RGTDCRIVAASLRLAVDLHAWRHISIAVGAGARSVATGVTAVSGPQDLGVAATGPLAASSRHRSCGTPCRRRGAWQSGRDVVQRRLRTADHPAVDRLFLQPNEFVP